MYPSHVPDEVHRAVNRRDVYYEFDWQAKGLLKMEARPDSDVGTLSPEDALAALLDDPSKHQGLAAVKDWRRVSTEQLGSILGWTELQPLPSRGVRRWSEAASWLHNAWDAGMIKRSAASALPTVYQSLRGPAGDSLQDRLTPAQLNVITSGTCYWGSPAGGGRHDVLATEFLLRVGEFGDVAAVLPESGAQHAKLGNWITDPALWGDGLISRADGQQIVLELTCTAPDENKLRRKVDGSIALILDAPSVAALYLEAAPPSAARSRVWNPLRRVVADAVADLGPAEAAVVHRRLAVARWRWYWPAAHTMHPRAVTLGAHHFDRQTASWDRIYLLDPDDLALPAEAAPQGLWRTHRSAEATANPYWLRSASS